MARRRKLFGLGDDEGTQESAEIPEIHLPVENVTVATVWLLRLVLRTEARSSVFRMDTMDADVATGLGFDATSLEDVPSEAIVEALTGWLERLEGTEVPLDAYLRNARALGAVLKIDEATADVLAFLARLTSDSPFGECVRWRRSSSTCDIVRACSVATGISPASVRAALDRRGPLRKMGLLQSPHPSRGVGRYAVQDQLAETLGEEIGDPQDVLRIFLRQAPAAKLGLPDYAHLGDRIEAMVDFLGGALARRAKGVNVLIHGAPGTGKSELARTLGAALGAELFEVTSEDEDGDPMNSYTRLCGAGVAQRTLSHAPRAMLVFDEIEDVFAGRTATLATRSNDPVTAFKAWTHRLMEDASVPTLWIGNGIAEMDPATLRRFDLVLEVGMPPESRRRQLVEAAFSASTLPETLVRDLVADPRTTPAHVAQAARVAAFVGDDPEKQARAVRVALQASLALAGPARRVAGDADDSYDLAFVNASVDLTSLTAALARKPSASICLYGPPGTGKTAFVHHLARRLDVPLHAMRMSDLLGMYVGETEKRIARAFAAAQAAGAVLFLDEIDGLLRDRASADKRWEVTQVNELLVQLEGFRGVFACATNLRETLDAASLRRFSLKVELLPLRAEQRVALLRRMVGLGEALPEPLERKLDAMTRLCAGDYAAVRRRLELLGQEREVAAWVEGLAEEHALKGDAKTPRIGFGS